MCIWFYEWIIYWLDVKSDVGWLQRVKKQFFLCRKYTWSQLITHFSYVSSVTLTLPAKPIIMWNYVYRGVNFQVRSLFSTHNFKWMIFFQELKKKKKLNPRVRAYSLFFIRHHDLILHMLHDVTILDSPWGANERLAKARRGQMVTLSADSLEALAQKSNRLQWISAADSAVKMTFMCWLAINSVASRLMNMQKDFCLAPLPRCTSTWATRCR